MAAIQEITPKLIAMNIEGVKTKKEFPPTIVSSAQLPYLYLRNLETGLDISTLSFNGGPQFVSGEIIILVGVSRQNTTEELYRLTRIMMDRLHAALELNASQLSLESWTIKEDFEDVETNSYFVVSCTFRSV